MQMEKKSKQEDNYIEIKGAKVNNLANINVKIPREKFIIIAGVSGSGKSSLAFDTLYAEGQRRYVEIHVQLLELQQKYTNTYDYFMHELDELLALKQEKK